MAQAASTPDAAAIKPASEQATAAKLAGDNAWMLTASALVLLMTAPGLAMFYGGLVRKKNVLGVMMQCVFLMGLKSVIWAVYGYSLAFGGSEDPQSKDFNNGSAIRAICLHERRSALVGRIDGKGGHAHGHCLGSDIPLLTHMLFQGMFFIITPALICGAFAERMKFSTMVVFTILWGTLVYCPLAHWVWGGGILAFGTGGMRSRLAAALSTSPAERSCTSARASRRWSARW